MRHRRPEQQHNQHDQFHLAFSDLFAGMVGVTMLFVLYFFTSLAVTRFLTANQTFTEVVSERMQTFKHAFGNMSESILCEPGGIRVPKLGGHLIPTEQIAGDPELLEYIKAVYQADRRAAFLIYSGGYGAYDAVEQLLYGLARVDTRYMHFDLMLIHENLDFVISDERRDEIRREWGLR